MALPDAVTREELYMKYLTGDTSIDLPLPITRKEIYLYYLCQNGTGGGGTVTPEQIEDAVNKYLDAHPVSADIPVVAHGTADITIELPAGEYHTWDEVTELTITLKAAENSGIVNEYMFCFTSGATATVLSLPEGVKTDIVVEPNTRYECSIVGDYMVFNDWSVANA